MRADARFEPPPGPRGGSRRLHLNQAKGRRLSDRAAGLSRRPDRACAGLRRARAHGAAVSSRASKASNCTERGRDRALDRAEFLLPPAKGAALRRYHRGVPTALVTGGAGFLGSHLCDYLLDRGHRVICVDNLVSGSLANIEHVRDDAFRFVDHDVTEPILVDEPIDLVFHFAALASPEDYLRMPLHSLKVGSYGTHNALGLSKFKRARFLLASTSEVYGDPQIHPQPETY